MTASRNLCPDFPDEWTPDVERAAMEHATDVYPQEAAGIVEGGAYVPLFNRSTKPGSEVALEDADLTRVAGAQVFFHSHPDGLGVPSADDMIYQQQLGIPFVIGVVPYFDLFAFGSTLKRSPLVGRGFRHGVHDCYSLIRDWYLLRGITALWDQPRGWEWWSRGQDLYSENFERAGFQRISPHDASKVGDVLLFNFNHKVPMHGAVVEANGLLLHHASGMKAVDATRLSAFVPRQRYQHLCTVALRHDQGGSL